MESGSSSSGSPAPLTELPFPPVTKSHILHCSYEYWYSIYRSTTPKARIIPLTPAFLEYLREDGIVLPDDNVETQPTWTDQDSGVYSQDRSDSEEDEALLDPSENFREIHAKIKETIVELGGKVAPKLNWSAPKDATWIAATNSMECRQPSDIYLLLKSSDFVSHDLEHAFDGCREEGGVESNGEEDIPYALILRKWIELNPSLEFRCFVRAKQLVAITQRDLNHFEFLFPMQDQLRSRISAFFDEKLKSTFPDENFTFDVYIPPPHKRVWLIDINPWAPRTDPLLFSWLEILQLYIPQDESSGRDDDESSGVDEVAFVPELRLVKKDDPEAYGFTTPQYSAHKMPKDVVEASMSGPGPMREFADQWKEVLAREQHAQEADSQDEG
ncbi:MAG: hypothetical protein M1833_001442 [Piccolia ochrophora]|nr:MAG: hypothetical protein M1833_001442 [Piccolia ochrophora]